MAEQTWQNMTAQMAFDGQPAQLFELTNTVGMSVVLMDIGACVLSCRLPLACGEQREVVLGVGTMTDFERQASYMGVTVGRYANRIAKGKFFIDGLPYQLEQNQAGNCLHGGKLGFNKVRWQVVEHSACHVLFRYCSADGEQGFPGNLVVEALYRLTEQGALEIHYSAKTDAKTPVNLTNHSYFNLDGAEAGIDVRQHQLWIDAQQYLPTDSTGIPAGSLASVIGSGFDFTTEKVIARDFLSDDQQQAAKGYDHSYYFEPNRDTNQAVARLTSQDKKVAMSVITDKPAMQLYTGNWLSGTPSRSGEYSDYAGVALESQFLPDSPNHPEWPQPDCILHPEQEYRFTTCYLFHI
ncbi:galactose-1-epimerase [Vibrio sinaloensis]|uniref:galactose-1-epimerase n=1 Tax=Photobacterium sp. (strain ATCC 43367) TaxID=379097 RepID=UPI0035EF162E